MYVPPKFARGEDEAWAIVEEAGAGMLVIAGANGLQSVYTPVLIDASRTTVRAHLAKANPWWREARDGAEVLGLFVAASAYVSPTYYPSRRENPGVVPTWNYVAAEVRGTLRLEHDPDWLREQTTELTDHFEEGRDPRWYVHDADPSYLDAQLKAIVGVSITVTSIEGKAKLSQNRPDQDHDAVRDHLAAGTWSEQITSSYMRRD